MEKILDYPTFPDLHSLLVPPLLAQSGSKVVAELGHNLQIPNLKPLKIPKGNNCLEAPATALLPH